MSALLYLTYISVVILLGLISAIIANKIKVPNVLILLLVGILLSTLRYAGKQIIEFPIIFIGSIALVALIMIVFDSSSRFKVKEFDKHSLKAIQLSVTVLILNIIFVSLVAKLLFSFDNYYLPVLFAALMSGTSPDVVLSVAGDTKNLVMNFLKVESIINTPIMVLFPFLILDLMQSVKGNILPTFIEQIAPFLQQIIAGIGSGILVGLIIFKIMRRYYSQTLSPLAMVGAALLSYILAENLGGNGVLSVTSAGLFFGNIYVKQKVKLEEFTWLFSTFLEILVFVLVGMLIKIPLTLSYFIKSFVLFLALVVTRYFAVLLTFKKVPDFNIKERIFMALNAPKGIAVAVVAVTLFAYTIPGTELFVSGLTPVLNLVLTFLLYSIILSSVTLKFSKYFVRATIIK